MRKAQNAPQRLASAEQIADALLNGSYDLENFPDVFPSDLKPNELSSMTLQVIQEILDRVRTLQQRAIAAETRVDHLNMRKPDRRINVEKECSKASKLHIWYTTAQSVAYARGFRDCAALIQGKDDSLPQ